MAEAPENPFWSFSIKVYAAPGVAAECLRLQDAAGADVNILLFCAWLGWERRIALTRPDIDAIAAKAGTWQASVVAPLRAVRRFAKSAASEAFHRQAAALELEAERHEQDLLLAFSQAKWGSGAHDDHPCTAMGDNITLYLSGLDNFDAPGGALSDLLRKALRAEVSAPGA